MPQQDQTQLLSQQQAAEILGVSPRTLEGWRYRGAPEPGLPFVKIGGAVRYRRRDLDAFIEGRMRTSTSDAAASQ